MGTAELSGTRHQEACTRAKKPGGRKRSRCERNASCPVVWLPLQQAQCPHTLLCAAMMIRVGSVFSISLQQRGTAQRSCQTCDNFPHAKPAGSGSAATALNRNQPRAPAALQTHS